ncbi:hypothetical protein C8J56DRAFT_970820 [Mycena floridula]|nr:hypothetical protein C8J56DRAFT_970820 [Mycena floridula]
MVSLGLILLHILMISVTDLAIERTESSSLRESDFLLSARTRISFNWPWLFNGYTKRIRMRIGQEPNIVILDQAKPRLSPSLTFVKPQSSTNRGGIQWRNGD